MIDELRSSPVRAFTYPALLLTGLVFVVALVLAPFALTRTDSGGLAGLAGAGAVCLAAGLFAEGIAWALARRVPPVGIMLIGMAVRVVPPLAICVGLLASGQSGRQHLAFISYLLLFYLATLGLETYFAVKRAGHLLSNPH